MKFFVPSSLEFKYTLSTACICSQGEKSGSFSFFILTACVPGTPIISNWIKQSETTGYATSWLIVEK